MTSSYGPIVTAWDVEQAVRDTLQAWIDTLLGEVERQSGGRWNLRQIQRPRSWFILSSFHEVPEKLLPAIHVESAAKDLDHGDGGQVHGVFPMVVQGLVKAQDRLKAREVMAAYEAACSVILEKQGSLGGFAAGTAVSGARYDLVPPEKDRTLLGFEIPISVAVDHIADRFGGPPAPDDPPPTPLPPTSPEDPDHLTTNVSVTEL